MQAADIHFLKSDSVIEKIELALDMAPEQFALELSGTEYPAALLAGQLKSLQRARLKLPSWFAARCILPPRAFEQASSESVAAVKPLRSGERALDLSAGLGVDVAALAGHYSEVIAVEQDAALCQVLTHNMALLGHQNVKVVHSTAERFLATWEGERFDMVYVDPDRRDGHGRRRYALADCRPNVLEIRPALDSIAHHALVKLSPMLDLQEAERLLRPAAELTVLAAGGECKELLVRLGRPTGKEAQRRAIFQQAGEWHNFLALPMYATMERHAAVADPTYLYESDVALYKAGIVQEWLREHFPELAGGMFHPAGYAWAEKLEAKFPGRIFHVLAMMPYKPRPIKKFLRSKGIQEALVSRRNFDLPVRDIRKRLGLNEGGTHYLLFSRGPDGQRYAFWCERLR